MDTLLKKSDGKMLYGIFYKSKDKWFGPAHGELYTLKEIKECIKHGNEFGWWFKGPLQVRKQVWKKTNLL